MWVPRISGVRPSVPSRAGMAAEAWSQTTRNAVPAARFSMNGGWSVSLRIGAGALGMARCLGVAKNQSRWRENVPYTLRCQFAQSGMWYSVRPMRAADNNGAWNSMGAGDLALLAWCDLGAIMRTRPVVLDQLDSKRRFGLGWAAAGCAMTPFDGIVANPWGSVDEVRQVPVDGASVTVAATQQAPALHLHLTRMLDSTGAPADACPRNFCESALETLETETGLTLWTAFEH